MRRVFFTAGLVLGTFFGVRASAADSDGEAASYNVVWNSPGHDYRDSMPIGNGDLGLNLWTETNGDLVFLIGKSDAWTENGELVKLGRVRVKFEPAPFVAGTGFRQALKLRDGEIEIKGQFNSVLRVWVDASAPVIHLEFSAEHPATMMASVELWRTQTRETFERGAELWGMGVFREWNGIADGKITIDADTILPAEKNQLTWLHRNERSLFPLVFQTQHLESLLAKYPDPLLHRTFGVTMKGDDLTSSDNQALKSVTPRKTFRLDLYALAAQTDSIEKWQKNLNALVVATDKIPLASARTAHQQWWKEFWNRSWIVVGGDENAKKVTQGFAMQRWLTAIGGRGAMPMKFNGGIFTVGQEPPQGIAYDPVKGERNADYRNWGGNYWFQNTRLIYWPMIVDGDLDLLAPFYKMYRDDLPLERDRARLIYHHAGVAFPETMFFWGLPNNNDYGWNNPGPDMQNRWIRWHVNNGLELTTMMLDTYDCNQNPDFAKDTLVPIAYEITTWFNEHWRRTNGKLHFEPSAALETRQWAINPTPDIAGLKSILPRLLALPDNFTTPAQRQLWQRMLNDLPPLPIGRTDASGKCPQTSEDGTTNGVQIIWPAEKFSKPGNSENPELYAVYPYRLFGVGLPQLDLAQATYDAKLFADSTCWGQQGIQAACLGWADKARQEVIANFTAFGGERFKWFWKPGHDWEPDLDNGGAGQIILQNMLLQTRGDKLLLFPAWPKDWDVDFKLHTAKNTVVKCSFRGGKMESLEVTPRSRLKDIVLLPAQ